MSGEFVGTAAKIKETVANAVGRMFGTATITDTDTGTVEIAIADPQTGDAIRHEDIPMLVRRAPVPGDRVLYLNQVGGRVGLGVIGGITEEVADPTISAINDPDLDAGATSLPFIHTAIRQIYTWNGVSSRGSSVFDGRLVLELDWAGSGGDYGEDFHPARADHSHAGMGLDADFYSNPADAITAAAGRIVRFGSQTVYPFTASMTIPANTTLQGGGRGSTFLSHDFEGDLFTLEGGTTLADLTLAGNGATYGGRGLIFPNGQGKQALAFVSVTDFDDACIHFETSGGSLSRFFGVEAYRINALTGTERYAVTIDPAQQLSAVPRIFVGFDTGGSCAFDFGGANNVEIAASTLGDLKYTGETRAVMIGPARILNQVALTLDGHGNTIDNCDIHPQVTIAAGAQGCSLGDANTYNTLPVIDNSGNATNMVSHRVFAYTPTLSSGGTAPSLGNGTLTGEYERSGTTITCTVNLTIGSTTTLGTGDLRISLPVQRRNGSVQYISEAVIARGADLTMAPVEIAGALSYFRVRLPGAAGYWTSAAPGAMTTGDTLRATFTYTI